MTHVGDQTSDSFTSSTVPAGRDWSHSGPASTTRSATARGLGLAAALALTATACGLGGDTTSSGSTVNGSVVDNDAGTTGEIAVIWAVTSGDPDTSHFHGVGSFADDSFSVDLPDELPPEALNAWGGSGGVGVGVVAGIDGDVPPVGPWNEESDEDLDAVGAAPQHAIIYIESDAESNDIEWANEFPVGYSCGAGVDAVDSQSSNDNHSFDTFVPVDCSEVEFVLGDPEEMEFTSWT